MSNCRQYEYSSQERKSEIATRIFAKILKSAFKQYRKLWDEHLELIRVCENGEVNQENKNTDKTPLNDSLPMHTTFLPDEGESSVLEEVSDIFIPDSQCVDDSPNDFELDATKRLVSLPKSPVFINKRKRYSKRWSLSRNDTSKCINASSIDTSLPSDKQPVAKNEKESLGSPIADVSEDDLYLSVVNSSLVNVAQRKLKNIISGEKTDSKLLETSSAPNNSDTNNSDEHLNTKPTVSLGISKLYNVDTKVLTSGKKLKQTRLMFQPSKENIDVSILGKSGSSSLTKPSELNKQNDETVANIEETPPKFNKTFDDDIVESTPNHSVSFLKNKVRQKLKRKHKTDELAMDNGSENIRALEDKSNLTFGHLQNPSWCSTQMEENSNLIAKPKTICNITPIKSEKNIPTDLCIPTSPIFAYADKYDDILVNSPSIKQEESIRMEELQEKIKICDPKEVLEKSDTCASPTCYEETFFAPAEELKENNIQASQHNHLSKGNVVEKSKKASPPIKRMLLSSFNKVPWRNEYIDDKTKNRAERQKMNGWSCWQCKQYYEGLGLSEEQLQIRKNQCSRHRSKYDEKPCTPASFWDPAFPDTSSSSEEDK